MVSFPRFPRARRIDTDMDTKMEEGKVDKRFSTLFISPDAEGVRDERSGRERTNTMRSKMDRRFSTFLESLSPPTPPRDDSPPSSRSANKQEEKMGRKFSMFGSLDTTTPVPRPATSQDQSTESKSEKGRLKGLMRRIFTSPQPQLTNEEYGQRIWDSLIGSTPSPSLSTPPSSSPTESTKTTTTTNPKTKKQTKQRSQTTVIVPPPFLPRLTTKRSGLEMEVIGILKGKRSFVAGNGAGGGKDSKFSSITSLPSMASLSLQHCTGSKGECGVVKIRMQDMKVLESCVRRLRRVLAYQEYQTSSLSTNLLFLFARKEKQLLGLRRLHASEKQALTGKLFRVKENCGRTFLRKAVFLQRSQEVVAQLSDLLAKSKSQTRSLSISEASSGEIEKGGMVEVDDRFLDLLSLLKEDLRTQRELDDALLAGVLGAMKEGEGRWASSVGERTMLRKFEGFLRGRVDVLGRGYGRVEGVVGRAGSVVGC